MEQVVLRERERERLTVEKKTICRARGPPGVQETVPSEAQRFLGSPGPGQ